VRWVVVAVGGGVVDEAEVVVAKTFLRDILESPSSRVETFVDCGNFHRQICH